MKEKCNTAIIIALRVTLAGLLFCGLILTCIIMGPVLLVVAAISFIVYVLLPKHNAQ